MERERERERNSVDDPSWPKLKSATFSLKWVFVFFFLLMFVFMNMRGGKEGDHEDYAELRMLYASLSLSHMTCI